MYTNIIHNDDICNYFLKNQQFIFNSLGNCRECRMYPVGNKFPCADKSKFMRSKSQFIEMFGDTHKQTDNSHRWREVVTIINGKDYKSVQVDKGGHPVYGTGGEIARASEYLCPENSVLIGRKGTIDKPLFLKEKYWNVDTAFGVIPNSDVLDCTFFYWHCKFIDFKLLNKGTTLPSTTKEDLLNLWIIIPDLPLQNKFASLVEQADKSKLICILWKHSHCRNVYTK